MNKKEILELLRKIPKGKVTTYKEIGDYFDSKAYRFIGRVMSTNDKPDYYFCYKVIKSNGDIGNFALGVKEKIRRLKKDKVEIKGNRVALTKYKFKFSTKDL